MGIFECRLHAPLSNTFGFLCVCRHRHCCCCSLFIRVIFCVHKFGFIVYMKPLIIDFKMIDISDSIRCNLFKNVRWCIFTAATITTTTIIAMALLLTVCVCALCSGLFFGIFLSMFVFASVPSQPICNDYRRILYPVKLVHIFDRTK